MKLSVVFRFLGDGAFSTEIGLEPLKAVGPV